MLVCEKVTVDRATVNEVDYVVQYDSETGITDRDACLAYLQDCGHSVDRQPHRLAAGQQSVSWGTLSDLIEPRDM